MRYLVISDIHANIDALDTVLADAASIGYDAVLCLGDLVGYGAAPSASIERVVELAPAGLIRGNHDKVIAGLEPPILFNEVARKSVDWTQGVLSSEATKTLADLAKDGATGARTGMSRGLGITGGVITSAGVVLAATFAALAVIPILFLLQLAFIVAFGVLLDTVLVRSLLVPALGQELGRRMWWPSRRIAD